MSVLRDGREVDREKATIMKGLLGDLVPAIGITHVYLGFLWTIQGWMLSHCEPGYRRMAVYGVIAVVAGALLCGAGWRLRQGERR